MDTVTIHKHNKRTAKHYIEVGADFFWPKQSYCLIAFVPSRSAFSLSVKNFKYEVNLHLIRSSGQKQLCSFTKKYISIADLPKEDASLEAPQLVLNTFPWTGGRVDYWPASVGWSCLKRTLLPSIFRCIMCLCILALRVLTIISICSLRPRDSQGLISHKNSRR